MFQLPVCPYCNTIYRYKDVKKTIGEKEHTCYHCNKKFAVKKFPGVLVLWLLLILVAVVINVVMLLIMPILQIIPVIVTSILAVLLALVFIPYFMGYKKIDEIKERIKKS